MKTSRFHLRMTHPTLPVYTTHQIYINNLILGRDMDSQFIYHCAQENQGCQPIIFFVKRAGTVQPSLFLLKFPSVQQHEGFPGIAHRHQHPGEQVEFRQAPAGTGREDRGKFLFPRPDPGSTAAPAKRKPAATKISGKEILEAIRLMDAEERRELTRALFA